MIDNPPVPTPHVPLDPRYIAAQRVTRWITVAILAGLSLPAVLAQAVFVLRFALLAWLLVGAWVMGLALLAWWAQAWPPLAYRHASYALDEQGIEIRRGVVWRRVINVPRSRVQHTDVSQGPIERTYELGTLVMHTAGTDYARVDLPGLPYAEAFRIRDHLLPTEDQDAV